MIRIAILLLLFNTSLFAATKQAPVKPIRIGIYLTSLYNFDYSKGTFSAGYYLWTVADDPNYDPTKSLEVVNAIDYRMANQTRGKNPDGTTYTTVHLYNTNLHYWNVKHFPFDRQQLKIIIEDASDLLSIKFKPDLKESGIIHTLKVEGWDVQGMQINTYPFKYKSNFGNEDYSYGLYSRLTVTISLKREGLRLFVNYFIGFFVALILTSLIFFIDPKEIGTRSGYVLSSLFASVGNKYIIDGLIPPVTEFTLIDAIQFLTFAQVLIAVFTTLYVFNLAKSDQHEKAKKISQRVGYVVVPMVFILLIFFSLIAMLS
ncbi:hypothetical protein [Legionella sp. W05-934-2]|uniref:hypothetical protein n=1 Tax=Legionella sp. W05-934-2 TaxID=1198649 RepID=UPI0034626371